MTDAPFRAGVVAVGRPTFDVAEARRVTAAAFDAIAATGWDVTGIPEPALDADGVAEATDALGAVDLLVVVQATFTDSTLPVGAAATVPGVPVLLWGIPEARTGQRLKLNSLCGINLAAFALARLGRDYRWLYRFPEDAAIAEALRRAAEPVTGPDAAVATPSDADREAAARLADLLSSTRIGLVGTHPTGFEPCGFEISELDAVGSPAVEGVELDLLFETGRAAADDRIRDDVASFADRLDGLEDLDPAGVEATTRIHAGLADLISGRGWAGVATRCWPECFTEFGGAACAGQARLGDDRTPGTCEADVFGTLTAIVLQEAADAPVLVADLVDVDPDDGTAAFWHCGIAPLGMAHPDDRPEAQVHPNRGLPLLNQFRLKPGVVTIARLSRSRGRMRITVGRGEVLDRPRPYWGTSGVVRPEGSAADLLDVVMAEGLEHHYGLVHGDVVGQVVALADRLGLDVVALTPTA